MVRQKLAELNLPYTDVIVPDFRPLRKQVFEVSGQYYVPVLKDGDKVLSERLTGAALATPWKATFYAGDKSRQVEVAAVENVTSFARSWLNSICRTRM